MNGQSGVARSTGMRPAGEVGREAGRSRRILAGRVTPVPTGPGRPGPTGRPRPVRRRVRPVPARRVAVGLRTPARVAGWKRIEVVRRPWQGLRAVALPVVLGLAAAVVVFALGALADVMAAVRVPDVTAAVVVQEDETLWQVAHRAAPSGEPAAVVRRIVELNDLASPSVQAGQVLLSPIG